MSKLYIVGTLHNDPEGQLRLDTLLDRLSPRIVALEFHKDRENLRAISKPYEESRREIEDLIESSGLLLSTSQKEVFIESGSRVNGIMGYELRTAREYTAKNGIRLEYIDMSVCGDKPDEFAQDITAAIKDSIRQMAQDPELVSGFLSALEGGIESYMKIMQANADQWYDNADELSSLYDYANSPEFEKERAENPEQSDRMLQEMFNPLRDEAMASRVRQLYDGSVMAVIVGLLHLAPLQAMLKDLHPIVFTLADYASV